MSDFSRVLHRVTSAPGGAQALAEALNLTPAYVSELRNRGKTPGAETAGRIVGYCESTYGSADARELREAWIRDRADPIIAAELERLRILASGRKASPDRLGEHLSRWDPRDREVLADVLDLAKDLPVATVLEHFRLAAKILVNARNQILASRDRSHGKPDR